MSERITVRSIIGRFLEHSRIFWFANDGEPEVFAGSADWMPRNLYERCEAVFPVLDKAAAKRLRFEILETYLCDTAKVRMMRPDGSYTRPNAKAGALSAQEWFMLHSQTPETEPKPAPPKQTVRRRTATKAATAPSG